MNGSAPWNKARAVGQRRAFEPDQVRTIADYLRAEHRWHELCIFTLGIDTMLRASDLLTLRAGDIAGDGNPVAETISLRQKKTKHGVHPVLTPASRQAAATWIAESGKRSGDHLFTGQKPVTATAISESVYRRLVKSWAEAVGLDSRQYSTHSLRRSKPIHLYRRGVPVERIAKLLGHKDTQTTLVYLGITLAQAQDDARRHDLFAPGTARGKSATNRQRVTLSDGEIDRIAERVTEMVVQCLLDASPKIPENLDFGEENA